MPHNSLEWIFLLMLIIGAVVVMDWFVIHDVEQVVAQHETILENLPDKIDKMDDNIIRLCTELKVDCVP